MNALLRKRLILACYQSPNATSSHRALVEECSDRWPASQVEAEITMLDSLKVFTTSPANAVTGEVQHTLTGFGKNTALELLGSR